jgi:hypothetical protein
MCVCIARRLGDVRALRQSVREVDASYYHKGTHQHLLEIEPAHRQHRFETCRCGCGTLEDTGSYARHRGRAYEVRAHAINLKRERLNHRTDESDRKGGCFTIGKCATTFALIGLCWVQLNLNIYDGSRPQQRQCRRQML